MLNEVPDKSCGNLFYFKVFQTWFSIKHFSTEHTLKNIGFHQSCSALPIYYLDGIRAIGFGNLSKIHHITMPVGVNTKKKA